MGDWGWLGNYVYGVVKVGFIIYLFGLCNWLGCSGVYVMIVKFGLVDILMIWGK